MIGITYHFCGLVGCGVKPVSDAKINYGSSSIYSEEDNIAWMNVLAEGQNLSQDFTQCIMFKSNFHSPKKTVVHGIQMQNIQIGNGGLLVQKAEIGICLHGDIETNKSRFVGEMIE